jgi:hypothetical protein
LDIAQKMFDAIEDYQTYAIMGHEQFGDAMHK